MKEEMSKEDKALEAAKKAEQEHMRKTALKDLWQKFFNMKPGEKVVFNTDTKKGDEKFFVSMSDRGILLIDLNGCASLKPWASFTEMVVPGLRVDLVDEGLAKEKPKGGIRRRR